MSDDARVERCRLAFVCGQRWEELERLPNHEQVRFCQRCQSSVHLATSAETFAVLAAQGRCVAVAIASRGTHGWADCVAVSHVSAGGGRLKQSIRGGIV
jgi:hypothetical protein